MLKYIMFGKLFGNFKNIGDKLRTGWNIGKKIFTAGKELYNKFFNSPPVYKPTENEKRIKNTYSLEQRISADKLPDIDENNIRKRFDNIRGIDRTNPTGFISTPVPRPPTNIRNDPFDIIPFDMKSFFN